MPPRSTPHRYEKESRFRLIKSSAWFLLFSALINMLNKQQKNKLLKCVKCNWPNSIQIVLFDKIRAHFAYHNRWRVRITWHNVWHAEKIIKCQLQWNNFFRYLAAWCTKHETNKNLGVCLNWLQPFAKCAVTCLVTYDKLFTNFSRVLYLRIFTYSSIKQREWAKVNSNRV